MTTLHNHDMSTQHSHDMHEHHAHAHAHAHDNVFADPVCGMTTENPDDFIILEHHGETQYFCSDHCMSAFKKNPDQYLSNSAHHMAHDTAPSAESTVHAVHATHVTPATPAVQTETSYYTCPMHPEVKQMEPGACPKCGMALEPVGVNLDEDDKNPEYAYMLKRFIFGSILTVPFVIIATRDRVISQASSGRGNYPVPSWPILNRTCFSHLSTTLWAFPLQRAYCIPFSGFF